MAAALLQLVVSCGPPKKGLFGDRRTEHEKYGDRIKTAGLDKTQMGSMWFIAAGKSLTEPVSISLPYKETGYFAADKPSAAGYRFSARRGDRISLAVSVVPITVTTFFAELWQPGASPEEIELIAAADSTLQIFHEVEEEGDYVVRLQPELLQGVEYTVTINTGPSLAFPVSESGNPKMISFWRDPRDNGARSHEGVDISAKFRTPVIASANGRVNRVMENRLGGKVVFMRPEGKNYSLYYAHLDTQTVSTGEEVKIGQVLGLVGNTGNAKTTVPHLHFGIYAFGGAVDPFPFINANRKSPKEITAPLRQLNEWVTTTRNENLLSSVTGSPDTVAELQKGSAVQIVAAADNLFRVQLPDGRQGYLNSAATTEKILRRNNTDTTARVLDQPFENAAAITVIDKGTVVNVVGTYEEYYLVRINEEHGWLKK